MRLLLAMPMLIAVMCLGLLAACTGRSSAQPLAGAGAQAGADDEAWPVAPRLRWSELPGLAAEADAPMPTPRDAYLGLAPGTDFAIASGRCDRCGLPDAALRYFRDDIIAIPRSEAGPGSPGVPPRPPLVWIGAPGLVQGATLAPDGRSLDTPAGPLRFALPPPIPTNRAYPDRSTRDFLGGRPLRVRGAMHGEGGDAVFVARTLWPEETRIAAEALPLRPLRPGETLATLVRAQDGERREAFEQRLLWLRRPDARREWAGRAGLAFVLNGAQGDDDGAHGGHLAVATGLLGPNGEWADWLVANFYPLDEPSEKGILTAPVPMDSYLTDVNSGQAFYRPNYLVMALFRGPEVPSRVQAALQAVYLPYWCAEVEYHHGRNNSTALGIDPLRELGWDIPRAGVTSRVLGAVAFPVAVIAQRSLSGGRDVFDMFATEKTRLVPRVAFEAAGHDLLRLAASSAHAAPRALSPFERVLADEVEAVLFLRFPQLPSSRRTGTYPVDSLLEYAARVPWRAGEREQGADAGEWPFPRQPERPCPARGVGRAGE